MVSEKMFENVDGRLDAGVILIAHLGAFGSGKLINRFGEIKQYTKLSSVHVYCVCEYEYGRYLDCVSNIYGYFGRSMI